MPFDGDWLADNALGDLNSPDIGLARIQPRFYLPTGPMQGLTTEWHGPSDLQIVAGGGVPGIYDGILVPDFRTLDGSTATAGAQWSPASHWTVGGQFIEAHDVNLAVGTAIENSPLFSSDTGLLTAAWADGGEHVQMNLLDGDVNGKGNARRRLGRRVDHAGPDRAECRHLSDRPQCHLGQPADCERCAGRLLPIQLPEPAVAGGRRHRRGALRIGPRHQHHLPYRRHALPDPARLGYRGRRQLSA